MEKSRSIEFTAINSFDQLGEGDLQAILGIYCAAFADPPYEESFTPDDSLDALQKVTDAGGVIIFGKDSETDDVVSLAAGHRLNTDEFLIDELAVSPNVQHKGIGRTTLKELIGIAGEEELDLVLCTHSTDNPRALGLYRSEGFVDQDRTKVESSMRTTGNIGLDERVFLVKSSGKFEMDKSNIIRHIAVAYPSGNATAVVFDQMLDSNREELNSKIMESWSGDNPDQPEIEQCCFITFPENSDAIARVEMFGGEFCGNATRSAIWLLTDEKDYKGKIEVSGVDNVLEFEVNDGAVTVEMPIPATGALVEDVYEGKLVNLDGISQLVVTDTKSVGDVSPRELLEKLLASNKYDLKNQPAVGVSYYDSSTKTAKFCVWVNNVDTIFDETACGSGTCAIGVALASANGKTTKLEVIQPSGQSISTTSILDGSSSRITKSTITGEVNILFDGELALDDQTQR